MSSRPPRYTLKTVVYDRVIPGNPPRTSATCILHETLSKVIDFHRLANFITNQTQSKTNHPLRNTHPNINVSLIRPTDSRHSNLCLPPHPQPRRRSDLEMRANSPARRNGLRHRDSSDKHRMPKTARSRDRGHSRTGWIQGPRNGVPGRSREGRFRSGCPDSVLGS